MAVLVVRMSATTPPGSSGPPSSARSTSTDGLEDGVGRGRAHAPEAFEALVDRLLADELEETPRREGCVPATALWMIHEGEFVGFLQIRHRLTPFLLEEGGHIGYSVRPSARRRGPRDRCAAGGAADREGARHRARAGHCDEDNVGSRTVIERVGGEYEDSRKGKRRYWFTT